MLLLEDSPYIVCRLDVVTLQFSHERRDRRKREYVMIERNHDAIIEILAPISEDNREAFSLASKVEVQNVHVYARACVCIYKHEHPCSLLMKANKLETALVLGLLACLAPSLCELMCAICMYVYVYMY